MNIIFFGASVTQQTKDSAFVSTFKNLITTNNLDLNIIQHGYGSMHLNDAGICKINNVILDKPNICFIDWFSTGFVSINKNYLFIFLDVIVRKLMLINSDICFLLLDRLDMNGRRLKMYDLVIEYSELYNLKYIKLYNNENVNELLRDTVHTNIKGANLYANKIYDYFINNMYKKSIIYDKIPNENEYYNINTLPVNQQINNEINLNGNFKIIGIFQKIGNFSGLLEITRDNLEPYNELIWDQWCHFTRNNIKINIPLSETVKLKVLQDSFDTSQCKYDIDFNNITKYMYIYEIYFLGDLNIEYIN
jgi:hypothetical protein